MDASPSNPDPEHGHIRITPQPDDDWHRHCAAFTYDSGEGWTATGTLTRTRRRGVIITEIRFHGPTDDDGEPGAVTSAALRHIPTGEIIATAMHSDALPPYEQTPQPASREPKRQPGRQPLSDDLIRDVAIRYLAETDPGLPRGAIQRLANYYDKPAQTISRWVMRARADGWLGAAVPGREGGGPGPLLLASYEGVAERELTDEQIDEIEAQQRPAE